MKVTVDNLDQASAQDVFETIARHLLTQNAKSGRNISPSDIDPIACAYRGEFGRQCAAGVLIPDDKYHSEMDCGLTDSSWGGLVEKYGFSKNHSLLIISLQYLHDNKLPENWKEGLIEIAMAYNLSADFILLEFVK